MNDYLKSFESYKGIKEIDDLYEEIKSFESIISVADMI